jgi:hypothetical protein
MPDVGTGVIELVSRVISLPRCMKLIHQLEEEMRYLQRKKAVRELDGVRTKVSHLALLNLHTIGG